jgi:hypothetical protein
MAYLAVSMVMFVVLLFAHIPALHDWFGAERPALWTLGGRK